MAVDWVRVEGVAGVLRSASRYSARRAPAGAREPNYLAWLAVALAALAFNAYAIVELRAGHFDRLSVENGPLETTQLLVLLPALAFFGLAWAKGRGAVAVSAVLLGILGAVAFVREVDLEGLHGLAASVGWLLKQGLQDSLFAVAGAMAVLYLVRQRRYSLGLLRLGLRWQAWPFPASMCLLAAAEFYLDGNSGPTALFWEELVETNGYALFALAAWRHSTLAGDRKLDSPL
jgi:hypothetical protein